MKHPQLAMKFVETSDSDGIPKISSATAQCPQCGALSLFHIGFTKHFETRVGTSTGGMALRRPIGIAECVACGRASLFIGKHLVYPAGTLEAPKPHEDMPLELVEDYQEARAIVGTSPRAAAALLRLAVQKLCPILGATKSTIDLAIGELIASGAITTDIQRALDVLRVVGNESVHPGQINLNDDRETAFALFSILNFIVERAITEPKRVAEIYAMLPANKLKGIADRDGNKSPP